MTQHTQGEWKVCKNEPSIVYVDGTGNDTVICVSESQNGINEARANARLIAAAPKLLEALEFALKFHNMKVKKGEHQATFPTQLLDSVISAIAAATVQA